MCEFQFRENTLSGVGVPLRVLVSACATTMTWVSVSWGYHEEDENVFVAGTTSAVKEGEKYIGPVSRSLSPERIDEYSLSTVPYSDLGINKTKESFELAPGSQIDVAIWMHDDCFFAAQSMNDATHSRFMNSILLMHSHYLSEEIDWGEIPDSLMNIANRGKRLRLASDQLRKRLSATQETSGIHWQFWKTRYEECLSCELKDGKPILHLAN